MLKETPIAAINEGISAEEIRKCKTCPTCVVIALSYMRCHVFIALTNMYCMTCCSKCVLTLVLPWRAFYYMSCCVGPGYHLLVITRRALYGILLFQTGQFFPYMKKLRYRLKLWMRLGWRLGQRLFCIRRRRLNFHKVIVWTNSYCINQFLLDRPQLKSRYSYSLSCF